MDLSTKLVNARELRGWSQRGAARRMALQLNTLRTLEGRNQYREPADGGEVKLKTAVAIMTAYWPDVELVDFIPKTLVRVVPRAGRYRQRLKALAAPDSPEVHHTVAS